MIDNVAKVLETSVLAHRDAVSIAPSLPSRGLADIVRHELIGLKIEVTASKNQSLVGLNGKIVDETKNTLKVRTNSRVLTIMKNAIMFKANIDGRNIEIDGNCLVARSEDRIKK